MDRTILRQPGAGPRWARRWWGVRTITFTGSTAVGRRVGKMAGKDEITHMGATPLRLADGVSRQGLQDGDEVILRGRATRSGFASIGFGDCTGRIVAA